LLTAIAAVDIDSIVTVIIFFLAGVFWLLRRLADAQEQRRRQAARSGEADREEEQEGKGYHADEDEVRKFLQSLGMQPETTRQEQEPTPAPTQAPGRPPGHPQRPSQPTRTTQQPGRPPERPSTPTSRPAPEQPAARRPRPRPKPAGHHTAAKMAGQSAKPKQVASRTPRQTPPPERPFGAPEPHPSERRATEPTPAQEKEHRTAGLLEFSGLPPLQRAVVLSEILPRKRGPHRHQPHRPG
jgi:hypothetical protein